MEEKFYNDGVLILDDVLIEINENPDANIKQCIHTPVSTSECNPLELRCDDSCQGSGFCPMNPRCQCYNMSLDDYADYLSSIEKMEQLYIEFLDSEEGQTMLEEIKQLLNQQNEESK